MAFKIEKDGQVFDYRLGKKLNLLSINKFFQSKNYEVVTLESQSRHIIGILKRNGQEYFLKLATTKGISLITEIESDWNKQFNQLTSRTNCSYWVPKVFDQGYYQKKLFYMITDVFKGKLLALAKQRSSVVLIKEKLPLIIELSQLIQGLSFKGTKNKATNHQQWFIAKAQSWYEAIPKPVIRRFPVKRLLSIVKNNASLLAQKPRHGDYAPWHLFDLGNQRLGLIDGEHFLVHGVEYYDIGYFIQRVFSVLQNPTLAKEIISTLASRGYDLDKLRVILAARAIGGFLDASLVNPPDYSFASRFAGLALDFKPL